MIKLKNEEIRNELKNKIVEKSVEPAINFIRKIKNRKVVIAIDDDSDGCCSGAIIALVIKKLYGYLPKIFSTEFDESSLTKKVVNEIKDENPDYVILCDIPKIPFDLLKELKKKSKVLIIDHHPVLNYKTAYCNPKLYNKKIYIPTSYLAYKIYKELTGLNDVCWIAGIGVIGDYGVKDCKDLFEEIKKLYYKLVDEIEFEDKALFERSLLGTLTKIVDSPRIVKGKKGVELVSRILLKNSSDDILNGRTKETKVLLKINNLLRNEFKKTVEDVKKNYKDVGKSVVYYEVKSRFRIKGSLGNYVIKFFDDKIIVIGQKVGGKFNFSLRRGKNIKIDLGKFAKKIIKNIPDSSAGGHPEAAAGRIKQKYLKLFFENLRILANKIKIKL